MKRERTMLVRYVLPAALGGLGGFIASELVHEREATEQRRVEIIEREVVGRPAAEVLRRLEALERRAASPAAGVASSSPNAPAPVAPEAEPSELDDDEHVSGLIEAAVAEPRAVRWARDVESKVGEDLSALGAVRGFSLTSSRCGTHQCVFDLTFQAGASRDDVTALLHEPLPVNCPRTVHVSPGDTPDAPRTHGVVLLACANPR